MQHATDDRRSTAPQAAAAPAQDGARSPGSARRARKSARPMTARERTERVLAQRWGNPYCKPGWP